MSKVTALRKAERGIYCKPSPSANSTEFAPPSPACGRGKNKRLEISRSQGVKSIRKALEQCSSVDILALLPSRLSLSVLEFHQFLRRFTPRLADFTADREFHPALKIKNLSEFCGNL